MKRKIKCSVCGQRFHIVKAQVYQAKETGGVIKALADGAKTFDVMDCPNCGCQKAICVRMDKCAPDGE